MCNPGCLHTSVRFKIASTSWPSCLCVLSLGITGMINTPMNPKIFVNECFLDVLPQFLELVDLTVSIPGVVKKMTIFIIWNLLLTWFSHSLFRVVCFATIPWYYEILWNIKIEGRKSMRPKRAEDTKENKKRRKNEKHTKTFSTQQNQHAYELTETEAASTGPAWVFTRWYSWGKRIPNPGPISNWRPFTKKT